MGMKNPNIKWFHYPLKPIAWLLLWMGDFLMALGESLQYKIPFKGHFHWYRHVTDIEWHNRWNPTPSH